MVNIEDAPSFLFGGGEMGQLIRTHPWAETALGVPATWPRGLSTTMRLLLTTQHPMFIWWGPELIQFYNDSYCRSIGSERHPAALGTPGRECWEEIWPIIGPQIEQVMAGAGPTWNENHLVPITRNGHQDEVYWTYSYSPIDEPDAVHGVGGVLVICTETTGMVLAERAQQAERERLNQLFIQAPGFMAMLKGPEHRFEMANPAYLRMICRGDIIGKTVVEALPEVVGQGFVELLDEVYRSGKAFTSTGSRWAVEPVPGGPVDDRYVDFVYQPVLGDDGHTIGIFVEGYDVTGRNRAEAERAATAAERERIEVDLRKSEARLQILVYELQHRTRNLLGIIQAMVAKTLKTSSGLVDFENRFGSRIDALARVQGLLSRLEEHDQVDFDDLIRSELDALGASPGAVTLTGSKGIKLQSSSVQTLAMALHELATNALKYGALAQPAAHLAIAWEVTRDDADGQPWLHIIWNETGVTMAESAFTSPRRGQGRDLIERALPYQLRAITNFAVGIGGISCSIRLPVPASNQLDQRLPKSNLWSEPVV